MNAVLSADSTINQGWEAELHLGFKRIGAKTVLSQRQHRGPLMVQRPFYPEGGMCHVYVLHPPGGVVAGDRLLIDIHANNETEALITTPAAGKFYRSDGGCKACQTISLQIDAGAVLEWLPQETIAYEGAQITSDIQVDLNTDARFIGWEILALGRPAANEGFGYGEAQLSWQIFRDGQPFYLEKMCLDAHAFVARWGLHQRPVCGSMFACSATAVHLEAIRMLIGDTPGRGVTLIDDLLICRASDYKTSSVRHFFESVRAEIRSDIVLREDFAPRIWAT